MLVGATVAAMLDRRWKLDGMGDQHSDEESSTNSDSDSEGAF